MAHCEESKREILVNVPWSSSLKYAVNGHEAQVARNLQLFAVLSEKSFSNQENISFLLGIQTQYPDYIWFGIVDEKFREVYRSQSNFFLSKNYKIGQVPPNMGAENIGVCLDGTMYKNGQLINELKLPEFGRFTNIKIRMDIKNDQVTCSSPSFGKNEFSCSLSSKILHVAVCGYQVITTLDQIDFRFFNAPDYWSSIESLQEELDQSREIIADKTRGNHINIALVGSCGSGKSELINSFMTALQARDCGKIVEPAFVANIDGHATIKFEEHRLPGINITFVDSVGLNSENYADLHTELLVGEFKRESYMPIEENGINRSNVEKGELLNDELTIEQKNHCIIFCVPPNEIENTDVFSNHSKSILLSLRKIGIPRILAMTQIDRFFSGSFDMKEIHNYLTIEQNIRKLSEILNFHTRNIYPIKSYVNENFRDFYMESLIMHLILAAVDLAQEYKERKIKIDQSINNDRYSQDIEHA